MLRTGHTGLACVAALIAAILLVAAPGRAEEAASFKNKSVRMLIGFPVGGGTDLSARLVARFLAKYLPDEPGIVPQNMPGADGMQSMNYMAQQAGTDGLTLFAGSAAPVMPEIMHGTPGVFYDPRKFLYVGGIANTGTVMVATRDAQKRLASGAGEPIALAQVGGVRTGGQMVVWGVAYLGWKVRWVSGYPGTAETLLALRKGEVDMTDTADANSVRSLLAEPQFTGVVQSGVFAQGKLARRTAFADIPLISELLEGKLPKEAESSFRSWLETTQIGKFFALAPGTPDAYVASYRQAFRKVAADPEFARLAAAQLDSDYVMLTPEDVRTVIEAVVETPDADIAFLNRLRSRIGVPGMGAGR